MIFAPSPNSASVPQLWGYLVLLRAGEKFLVLFQQRSDLFRQFVRVEGVGHFAGVLEFGQTLQVSGKSDVLHHRGVEQNFCARLDRIFLRRVGARLAEQGFLDGTGDFLHQIERLDAGYENHVGASFRVGLASFDGFLLGFLDTQSIGPADDLRRTAGIDRCVNALDHGRGRYDVTLLADLFQPNAVFKQNAGEAGALVISRGAIHGQRTAAAVVAIADYRYVDIV